MSNFILLEQEAVNSFTDQGFIAELKAELFDFSKRNTALFFKGGKRFLELRDLDISELETRSSFVLKPDDPELHASLDKIRLQANKNTRELGFNQLNLVSHFVHWFHPKYNEVVVSPVLLIPVELRKKRGIASRYELKLQGQAVFNPVLLYLLQQLFGFTFPKESLKNTSELLAYFKDNDPELNIFPSEIGETSVRENHWFIDEKHPCLGNFDFRRMSLIQDYDSLEKHSNQERLQEKNPLIINNGGQTSGALANFHVLPSDPSQKDVIESVLKGKNLVVQGPPGTGKSQTLVNLCSNLLARGQKILLVCDKRAALDVVHSRLRSVGLDHLALYNYHTNEDRKELIQDLKSSYQRCLQDAPDMGQLLYQRQKLLDLIDLNDQAISRYFSELADEDAHGISLNLLFKEGLKYQKHLGDLSASDKLQLPSYHDIELNEGNLRELQNILKGFGYLKNWSSHPLAQIRKQVWESESPEKTVLHSLNLIKEHLEPLKQLKERYSSSSVDRLKVLFAKAHLLEKLMHHNLIDLADPQSKLSKKYDQLQNKKQRLRKSLKASQKKTVHWHSQPSLEDIESAIHIFETHTSWWQKLSKKAYKQAESMLKKHYNFQAHLIAPDKLKLLKNLKKTVETQQQLDELNDSFKTELNIEQLELIELLVKEVRFKLSQSQNDRNLFIQQEQEDILLFNQVRRHFEQVKSALKWLCASYGSMTLEEIHTFSLTIEGCLAELSVYTHPIKKCIGSQSFSALCHFNLNVDELKAETIHWSIEQKLNLRYWLKNTSSQDVAHYFDQNLSLSKELGQSNAQFIIGKHITRIKELIKLSESSVVGMDAEDRVKKKSILEGKRLLEREFSKSKRYKSLREIMKQGADSLLLQLKPVWLMSPYAIADNLDLELAFDVIIYDEASQARIEESYPSLFRARQKVVFGDDQQMPPSSYFRQDKNDELPESLLSYVSSKYEKKTLQWHYRSASKDLINFSNQHFYDGQLEVIPDQLSEEHELGIQRFFVEDGMYKARTNLAEARALLDHLRSLLIKGYKSIGIVAFSLEQANLIEREVSRLCSEDPVFNELIEASYRHEEKGVYEGLFIRNLESVQGDERDVILISVAYGKDDNQAMRQYFGPLSVHGGDRRLNVLLTRARLKMAVFTSLTSSDIQSNNSNVQLFKAFLSYVEQLDLTEEMELDTSSKSDQLPLELNESTEALYCALKAKGWVVQLHDNYQRYRYPELN